MLLQDSMIPVLVRAPATSIQPLKQYFKRLAGGKKSYLAVLTSLALIKQKSGNIDYSQIEPKAVRYLTPEEEAQVRLLRAPFQAALDADDAVEQAQVEKAPAEETLADMPTPATSPVESQTPAAAPTGDTPF